MSDVQEWYLMPELVLYSTRLLLPASNSSTASVAVGYFNSSAVLNTIETLQSAIFNDNFHQVYFQFKLIFSFSEVCQCLSVAFLSSFPASPVFSSCYDRLQHKPSSSSSVPASTVSWWVPPRGPCAELSTSMSRTPPRSCYASNLMP